MPGFQPGGEAVWAGAPFLHRGVFVKRRAPLRIVAVLPAREGTRYEVEYLDAEMQPHRLEVAERDLAPPATP